MAKIKISGAGGVLRELRERAELELDDVVDATGIDKSLLSRYENNNRDIGEAAIGALAEAYGITPEEMTLMCLKVAYPDILNTKLGRQLSEIARLAADVESRT